MKKRDLKELLAEMYADEQGTMLKLFCFNLISADALTDKAACETRLEKLKQLEAFLEEQEDSEKKAYYQKFVRDGREIIEKDLNGFMEEKKYIRSVSEAELNALAEAEQAKKGEADDHGSADTDLG